MNQDQFTILCMLGLLSVWIIAPLIPAILIYAIFPDTQVVASGPLSGLTVKASGAFGAYLIVFIACIWFVRWGIVTIDEFETPSWTIRAQLELDDPAGKPLATHNFEGLLARLSYSPRVSNKGMVTLRVPGSAHRGWRQIRLELPGFGYTNLEISDQAVKSRDERNKVLVLKEPLKIQASASTPYAQTGYAAASAGTYPGK